jgi:hypothetical protein
LENCVGTMVQSSLENIAIGFNRPDQLFFKITFNFNTEEVINERATTI